jgi:hypothetical protein
MKKRIPTLWLQDLEPDLDQDKFSKQIEVFLQGSVGRKFVKIVKTKLEHAEAIQLKAETYDKGGWPYYQAHLNGYKAFARDLLELMKFAEIEDDRSV